MICQRLTNVTHFIRYGSIVESSLNINYLPIFIINNNMTFDMGKLYKILIDKIALWPFSLYYFCLW